MSSDTISWLKVRRCCYNVTPLDNEKCESREFGTYRESQKICINLGVELIEVRVRGNDALLEDEHRLDDAGKSACPFQVPNVGLQGATVST